MPVHLPYTSSFTKIIIILEFLLVAYLLYSFTENIYGTYKIDQYIKQYERDNTILERDNLKKNEDYLYFTSEEYIDKIAKQNLGLINSGEEVIILSAEVLDEDRIFNDSNIAPEVQGFLKLSKPRQWWSFFFH